MLDVDDGLFARQSRVNLGLDRLATGNGEQSAVDHLGAGRPRSFARPLGNSGKHFGFRSWKRGHEEPPPKIGWPRSACAVVPASTWPPSSTSRSRESEPTSWCRPWVWPIRYPDSGNPHRKYESPSA